VPCCVVMCVFVSVRVRVCSCVHMCVCVCQSSAVKPWTSQASIGVVLFVCAYECVGICVWRESAHVFACVCVSLVP